MYKNKASFLVLASLFLSLFAVGQNNTNSPYTRYGYGDISDNNSGEQRAMGGVALGARSKTSINTVNPASYSAVDSMTFMFDLGASALVSRFSTNTGSVDKFTSNLDYITMQFPLAKHIGFSAGLLPYSMVGYDYSKTGLYETKIGVPDFDSLSYRNSFKGTGGLSQVYGGISANFFNHVSVGVNAYYMFGSIYNTKSQRLLSFSDSTTQYNSIQASNFRLRYGVQFYNTFAEKHDITLGLIYESKTKLNGKFAQTTYGVSNDTLFSKNFANDSTYELPQTFGVGLYYTYDNRLSVGLDYTLQEWKKAKFRGNYDLNNRSKLALGVQYIPNPRGMKFANRMSYRAGFNMSDAYYNVGATSPKNYGVSFGLGLPLYDNGSQTIKMLNLSFEYGKIGTVELLRENYFKFTLNLAFDEHMFFKRKL